MSPISDVQKDHEQSFPIYLCSCETPPGALRPVLESPGQERSGPVGAGAEEGHEDLQRAGTPLLWRKAKGVGVVQPGEEKVSGRTYCGVSIYKEGL